MFVEAFHSIFQKDFKESTLLQSIGSVITRAKDWEGGREERDKKTTEAP